MEGWKTYKLGDVAQIVKDSYNPKTGNHTPYIGLEHIEQQTLQLCGIGHSQDVTSNKFRFSSGDILFGKLRPYFRKVYRPKFDGVCSTDIWVLRSKGAIDQGFLYYYVTTSEFIDLASQGSTGTHMPRADWQFLKKIEIDLPSLPVQHRIAEILCALDDKIELNRQMNQTLEQMAQALYRHYFIYDIDPENLPQGWTVEPLSQIAEFLNGVALQKYPSRTGEPVLPVIKIKEMSSGITSATDLCSDNIPEKYLVNDGDLLFSWSGTLDVVFWSYGLGALNQHLFKVSSVRFPKWFVYQWILFYLEEFRDIAAGKATTMGHIQRHHLDEALVWYPTKPQFEKISTQIAPLVDIIIQNRVESVNLTKIRDTLLPKLISGELIPSDFTTIEQAL